MTEQPEDAHGLGDPERARRAATGEIAGGPAAGDPHFASWEGAQAGEPLVVRDLGGQPSYWLVPVVAGSEQVGSVRVLADGRVAALTVPRGTPVTALDAEAALRMAEGVIDRAGGEASGSVSLVHDGPPGREAWRIEVLVRGRPTRWIFVTPGGHYERPAGEVPDDEMERGEP